MAKKKRKDPTEKVGRNPKIADENTVDSTETKKSESKPEHNKTTETTLLQTIQNTPSKIWAKFKGYSRNTQLAIILAVVLIVVGLFAVILTGGDSPQEVVVEEVVEKTTELETISSSVSLQQGTLEMKDESGEWIDVPSDYAATEGDVLRTVGATSRSVILYEDGTELRLDANSEIEFLTLRPERIVVRHINGYTYSRVITNYNRSYIIESTNAQYEALGTAFKTASSGDEQAVEVYHGTVHETSLNEKPQEGEKLTIKNLTEPSKDGKIEKLDIEQVKQDQFMTWNKQLDEQNDNFKNDLGYLKDFDAPEVNITSHQDGDTVLLDSNATEGTIEFSGNTEKGAKLTVQSKSQAGSQPVDITVDDAGNFTSPVISAPLGNSVFEFVVKDRVGNTTSKNIRINFQRKSAPISLNNTVLTILTLTQTTDKVSISWTDTESVDGYKVVWSTTSSPTYEVNEGSEYVKSATSATMKKSDAGLTSSETYYFKVCEYDKDDDTCSNYTSAKSIEIN